MMMFGLHFVSDVLFSVPYIYTYKYTMWLGKLLSRSGLEFEDRYFPADNSSLYTDPYKAAANNTKKKSFRTDQDAFLTGNRMN